MRIIFQNKCFICEKEMKNAIALASHFVSMHKITTKEYYDKYYKSDDEGLCKICNKPTKLYSLTTGYRPYCSIKCKNADKTLIEQIKETTIAKYNGIGFGSDLIKQKQKETCKRLYDNENYNNPEKTKETCLEKYGVDNYVKTDEYNEKKIKTCLEKYGVEHPLKNNEIIEKIKTTKNKKYNDSNYNNFEQIKQTCLNRYGNEFFLASKLGKKNIKRIMYKKYGVEYSMQSPEIKEKIINSFYLNIDNHKTKKSKYFYNEIMFDSKPELAYYIWLTDNNIPFIYHPNIKFEYWFKNKKHHYLPDFKVNNEFHEIKGLHFFKEHNSNNEMINPYCPEKTPLMEAKHKCMIKNNIKIITDYQIFIQYVNEKYGKTFLNQFKLL